MHLQYTGKAFRKCGSRVGVCAVVQKRLQMRMKGRGREGKGKGSRKALACLDTGFEREIISAMCADTPPRTPVESQNRGR